mmetsp:Transcript_28077/g.41439  ORF Transcript_28077/g.41439 Transcript_28077/m.41439 type:complete len:353 (+) Transcript_28077:20-1078(+)
MAAWFEEVFGFPESRNFDLVRSSFRLEENDTVLVALPPRGGGMRRFHIGPFGTPSVKELRTELNNLDRTVSELGTLNFSHIIGSADDLHLDPANEGSVFQAASQFNCLEMVNPKVKPTDGITGYIYDGTQGPSCAIACPAATVYRNYLVNGGVGQAVQQIDTLKDIGDILGNVEIVDGKQKNRYWKMQNGYALPARRFAIEKLREEIESGDVNLEAAMESVRVGLHMDTEVFDASSTTRPQHRVAQVYCSAVPVGYDYSTKPRDWEPFAKLVLDATYDATLAAGAILSRKHQKRIKVFLTKVGGGVFRNDSEWIISAIRKALIRYRSYPLDVYLVHFRNLEGDYVHSLKEIK